MNGPFTIFTVDQSNISRYLCVLDQNNSRALFYQDDNRFGGIPSVLDLFQPSYNLSFYDAVIYYNGYNYSAWLTNVEHNEIELWSGSLTDLVLEKNISDGWGTVFGIAVDEANGLIYGSDRSNNRIIKYSMNETDVVLATYGGTDTSQVTSTPTNSTLFQPSRLVLDCMSNLWVCDSGNHRVLRYSNSTIGADLVLGQPSFSTRIAGDALSLINFNNPRGMAFNNDCTKFWVADSNYRILQFTSPFSSGQKADSYFGGTMGCSESMIGLPYDIAYDTDNNTLWIADYCNNRVLAGNPATPSPSSELTTSISQTASLTTTPSTSALATTSQTASLTTKPSTSALATTSQTASLTTTPSTSALATTSQTASLTTTASASALATTSQTASLTTTASVLMTPTQSLSPSISTSPIQQFITLNLTCQNFTNDNCVVQAVNLSNYEQLIFNSTILTITGTLTLSNYSQIAISANQVIISNSIQFAGTLIIQYSSQNLTESLNVTVARFNSSKGNFSNIEFQDSNDNSKEEDCTKTNSFYGKTSLSVVLSKIGCSTTSDDDTSPSTNTNNGGAATQNKVIIGVVVGIIGALIIIIIVIIIVTAIIALLVAHNKKDMTSVSLATDTTTEL